MESDDALFTAVRDASASNEYTPADEYIVADDVPSAGAIWRSAFSSTCERLQAQGLPPDRALELCEGAVIACALRGEPASVMDACDRMMVIIGVRPLS